ncbi:MAG: CotH kinase family protein [Bacteroidetes bacterium]|nr:CotH kinase family protein [Bacteroidota bacterium]
MFLLLYSSPRKVPAALRLIVFSLTIIFFLSFFLSIFFLEKAETKSKFWNKAEALYLIPTSPRWKPPAGRGREPGGKCSLPVVSIHTDASGLFGFEKGIYTMGNGFWDKDAYAGNMVSAATKWWTLPANYQMRGMNYERQAEIVFFDSGTSDPVPAGIRIHGDATRAFPQKSLRIHFRKKYGKKPFYRQLFPDDTASPFSALVLRNSGNDWDRSLIRDALGHSLVQHLRLDSKNYRPVVVEINGEYWGIHQFCNYQDEDFLASRHNLDAKRILIFDGSGAVRNGRVEDEKQLSNMFSFFRKTDMKVKENYDSAARIIDLDNYIDYIIAEVYCANADWPYANEILWKYAGKGGDGDHYSDGRWRWMITDLDLGFGFNTRSSYGRNMINELIAGDSPEVIFRSLSGNEGFRKIFTERFNELLNTLFHPDTVCNKIESMKLSLAPEIPYHITRWRKPLSEEKWQEEIDLLYEFARKRPEFIRSQLEVME